MPPVNARGRQPGKEERSVDIWRREKGVSERIDRQMWSKVVLRMCGSTDQTQTGYRASGKPRGAGGAKESEA